MKPLVSIIVPIFNSAKYLPECIESILDQNYPEFELLLIDDGSTDESGSICDQYAHKDSRILSFHQKNAGVSAARNRGIEAARGEYVAFVDADDKVSPSYISDFFRFSADLVIQGFTLLNQKSGESSDKCPSRTFSAQTFDEIGATFADAEICSTTKGPCAKLYKIDIIHRYDIRFDSDYSYGEDHLFVLEYVKHCQSIATINHSNYLYINHEGSLTNRLLAYKKLSDYAREAYLHRQELIALFGIENPDYDRYIAEERAHLIYQSIYALYSAEGNYPAQERWRFIEEVYRQDYDMTQEATQIPLIFRLIKIVLRWKRRQPTDCALLILSRGKEWIKKHL